MSLHKLVFDPTDTASRAASANVGAYVRAGDDGDLIASQTIAAEEWLNTAAALHDGAGNTISSTGNALDVNIASGDLTVDLDHTEDSVRLGNGTDFFTSTSENGDISLDVHVSNSDLDIRDLDANQDNVAISDGTDTLGVNADGSINVNTDILDTTMVANTLLVPAAATDAVTAPLAARKYLAMYNNDNKMIYVGGTGVTIAAGFPLPPGSMLELKAGPSIDIEVIASTAGQDLRTLEAS